VKELRNIVCDYAHRIDDRVAETASRYRAIVVLEDLNNLGSRVNGGSLFNKNYPYGIKNYSSP